MNTLYILKILKQVMFEVYENLLKLYKQTLQYLTHLKIQNEIIFFNPHGY